MSARAAQEELREVVGVLRDDGTDAHVVAAAPADARRGPRAGGRLIDHLAAVGQGDERRRAADQLRRLSPRGVEIADAIAQGKANAVIAAELHLSVATIKSHVSAMLATLQLENRVQLALLVQDARRA